MKKKLLATAMILLSASHAAEPLKALLVIGGCCHDYKNQQFILSDGLSQRANVNITIEYSDSKSTKPNFAIYKNADWAKGYDVVIHDECAADDTDPTIIDHIVDAHKNGVPAVNLHCAMHSYRLGNFHQPVKPGSENSKWYDMLGLQSSSHGPQKPIKVTYENKTHPVTKGLQDWTTINEELYNNVHGIAGNFKNWPTAKALARGTQDAGDKEGQNNCVIVWTNEFGPKKTKIFSTTLGHNNDTVGDARFLDLVARGLLWSCGKLGDDGKPLKGYEGQKK